MRIRTVGGVSASRIGKREPSCVQCSRPLNSPRPGGMCTDCRYTQRRAPFVISLEEIRELLATAPERKPRARKSD